MIIKFCYQNEIHRCSDPPKDFSLLYAFLATMFRTPIPPKIDLSYVNPEGQTIFINSPEDYENLVSNNSSKTVKILISEKKQSELQEEKNVLNGEFEGEAAEYEVIRNDQEEKEAEVTEQRGQGNIIEITEEIEDQKEPVQDEEEQILLNSQSDQKDEYDEVLLNKVSERISENYVMPQVQSNPGLQPAQVKQLVREALKEELPFIIAQLKETLRKEEQAPVMSKPVIAPVQEAQQVNKPAASYPPYYAYPYYYQPPISRINSYPGQPGQPVYQALPQRPQVILEQPQPQLQPQPQRMIFGPPAPINNSPRYAPEQPNIQQQQQQQEKRPHLLDKMANALSGPINKATEMMDNWVQKFEGDPYVHCPEGKYNKSVVEKVAQLKDIFPDENRKDLLDFVQRFPRDAPLDQLAEVYWSKKKMT